MEIVHDNLNSRKPVNIERWFSWK